MLDLYFDAVLQEICENSIKHTASGFVVSNSHYYQSCYARFRHIANARRYFHERARRLQLIPIATMQSLIEKGLPVIAHIPGESTFRVLELSPVDGGGAYYRWAYCHAQLDLGIYQRVKWRVIKREWLRRGFAPYRERKSRRSMISS